MADDLTALIAQIRDALDETEEMALAAGASFQGASGRAWKRDGISSVEDADGRLIVYGEETPTSAQADHIALHDPERELRVVAAHRTIVARHVRGVIADGECGQCGDPWPCGDLRALAGVYDADAGGE